MMRIQRSLDGLRRGAVTLLAALAGSFVVAGCGSGGDDSSGPVTPPGGDTSQFRVVGTSVLDGAVWQLNRPINIEFNQDIDFQTVSLSTIQIIDNQGIPAVGTFTPVTPQIVQFQPRCPTDDANSNGGFGQGRSYRLTVLAENAPGLGGGVTVTNTAGDRLQVGLNVGFTTPQSNDPLILFVDVVAGPPQVRVRGLLGEPVDSMSSSFVEFGDGTSQFFAFDPNTSTEPIGVLPAGSLVPLNLYSRVEDQFSIVLQFNQPVFAATSNVNSQLIGIEYTYDPVPSTAQWFRVPTRVDLINNCTQTGASVRVTPTGIVPQNSTMRVVVREGFQDLTGDRVLATQARVRFESDLADPMGASPLDGSDEILERFLIGGGGPDSLEDTELPSPLPRAAWSRDSNPDSLEASFDFDGTGGPGGDFDWRIRGGETVFLDTAGDQITGGPNGDPFFTQPVFNGVIDIDDLFIEPSGTLVITGPNPCTILATGNVMIEGTIILDGGDNTGVGTLNTTNQPEEGAAGNGGGGTGGVGSFLTSQSTPKGGDGNGAFDVPGLGGGGGETGFAAPGTCEKENRRGAGGGGGQLGPDTFYEFTFNGMVQGFFQCQTLVGLDGEPGFTGSPDGRGAISQSLAAVGGAYGPSPFLDQRDDNNFFGTMITAEGTQILGELTSIWAGAGGGAGGDAVRSATFPLTPFSPTGDEKGSGGGGGAGGLLVLAIGDISLIGDGSITADGGFGGGGENLIFFDRIGGGSGGGSGGHIILSSAGSITIESEATSTTVGDFYNDDAAAPVHEKRPLRALGGQGGAGRESRCGANEDGESQWRADAIPLERFNGNANVPPQEQNVWLQCNRIDPCSVIEPPEGTVPGGGGDGGPGIIQLHVADPRTQLLFPNQPANAFYAGVDTAMGETWIDVTRSMSPPPLGWSDPDSEPDVMVPFFSSRSEAFSKWIPLGLARLEPGNPPVGVVDQVEFEFQGTDPVTGDVQRNGTVATELAPLIDFTALTIGGAPPSVNTETAVFTFPGGTISELYKRNAALTREFAVRIRETGAGTGGTEFLVVSGEFNAAADQFLLTVDPRGPELLDLLLSLTAPEVQLVPFYFRLLTGGVNDSYPQNTTVNVTFDATIANPITAEPSADPLDSFSLGVIEDFTPDITALNAATWDFVRFRVEFDLASTLGSEVDLGAPRPGLGYLRIPYRF
ncbi:MAG: hypothetical protein AAF957_20125 [Planctomycetota bacterium]